MSKVVAIVQVRMGSTRLANKAMLCLKGTPILGWVISRLLKATTLDDIVIATTEKWEDDIICEYVRETWSSSGKVSLYRGLEDDVLGRFCDAAREYKAGYVVRVCADNPLVTWTEVDHLVSYFNKVECDYAYNHIPRNNMYPDGLGAEIVSIETLNGIREKAFSKQHEEHVFSYITSHPDEFKIDTFDPPDKKIHHPDIKLDIDTLSDYHALSKRPLKLEMTTSDIIDIFKEL